VVLELCAAAGIVHQERDISLAELYRADEVFCSGTMGELAAVVEIDGRQIGDGMPGQVCRRLSELFAERTRREGVVVVD
jgi:branched-chain amino acid aminotransferase